MIRHSTLNADNKSQHVTVTVLDATNTTGILCLLLLLTSAMATPEEPYSLTGLLSLMTATWLRKLNPREMSDSVVDLRCYFHVPLLWRVYTP